MRRKISNAQFGYETCYVATRQVVGREEVDTFIKNNKRDIFINNYSKFVNVGCSGNRVLIMY